MGMSSGAYELNQVGKILTRQYLAKVLHTFFGKFMLTECRLVGCFLGSQ